jgi:predicted nucleotidyltransferase
MSAATLPPPVAAVASALAALPGVEAVALGGSRATGEHRADSDWDLGLYYRSSSEPVAPDAVRALGYDGYVSERGEWGPIVNGGAWLTVEGTRIDVLYRDLDPIERWIEEARDGRYEVLTQNGYLAGAPTYLPMGELAVGRAIHGELPRPDFPEPLASSASERWSARAGVALVFAEIHASAADVVACAGMLALALLAASHARLAARREWVLNEKRLVERAGLGDAYALLQHPGSTAEELLATVASSSRMIRPPSTPRTPHGARQTPHRSWRAP